MAFRNDLDALRAQNETLEREVARLAEDVARLEPLAARAERLEEELAREKATAEDLRAELGRGPEGAARRRRRSQRLVAIGVALAVLVGLGSLVVQLSSKLGDERAAHEEQQRRAQAELLRAEENLARTEAELARTREVGTRISADLRLLEQQRDALRQAAAARDVGMGTTLEQLLRAGGVEVSPGVQVRVRSTTQLGTIPAAP